MGSFYLDYYSNFSELYQLRLDRKDHYCSPSLLFYFTYHNLIQPLTHYPFPGCLAVHCSLLSQVVSFSVYLLCHCLFFSSSSSPVSVKWLHLWISSIWALQSYYCDVHSCYLLCFKSHHLTILTNSSTTIAWGYLRTSSVLNYNLQFIILFG